MDRTSFLYTSYFIHFCSGSVQVHLSIVLTTAKKAVNNRRTTMNIKTTIGIIAVVISSISMAEAGQNRHQRDNDRHYEQSRQGHHYRHNNRRPHWKRARHARHHYREQRHYGSRHHHYKRSHRHHTNLRRDHGFRHSTYSSPRVYSSHSIVVRNNAHSGKILPVIAGGLIGSSIANNASHGDPAATFGGAVFGALVGNALTRH